MREVGVGLPVTLHMLEVGRNTCCLLLHGSTTDGDGDAGCWCDGMHLVNCLL